MLRALVVAIVAMLSTAVFAEQDPYTKTYGPLENVEWMTPVPDTIGKHRLLVFWTTWCGPCIAEIPTLNELQKKYSDQLVIVGVNVEGLNHRSLTAEEEAKIAKVVADKIQYSAVFDKNNFLEDQILVPFNIRHVPHAVLLDPQGRMIWMNHPALLGKHIEKLLDPDYINSAEFKADFAKVRHDNEKTSAMLSSFKKVQDLAAEKNWDEVVKVVTKAEAEFGPHHALAVAKTQALLNGLGYADEAYKYAFEIAQQTGDSANYRLYMLLTNVFYSKDPTPKEFLKSKVDHLVQIFFDQLDSGKDEYPDFYSDILRGSIYAVRDEEMRASMTFLRAYGRASDDEKPIALKAMEKFNYSVFCEADVCSVRRIDSSCEEVTK